MLHDNGKSTGPNYEDNLTYRNCTLYVNLIRAFFLCANVHAHAHTPFVHVPQYCQEYILLVLCSIF